MRIFLFFIAISFGIAWFIVTLSDCGPDGPILLINKRKFKGNKYIYVAFKADKKSPWRRIGRLYEESPPNRKQMYQYALTIMDTPQFRNSFEGTEEEWNLMYSLVKEEVSD